MLRWSLARLICVACALPAATGQAHDADLGQAHDAALAEKRELPERRWFLMLSAVNTYPRLESEELIERFYDAPLRRIAPTYDDVTTVGDLRDNALIWPPHLGLGYNLSDRLSVQCFAGHSAGTVRTRATDRSVFLVNLRTDFELSRGATFAGIGVDFFPWAMPRQRDYTGLWARLRAARPSLGGRITLTHATYDVKARLGFGPGTNLLTIKLDDAWTLPSMNMNAGVDIPLDARNALFVNAGYNFFADQQTDFEGWSFTLGYKRFFRWQPLPAARETAPRAPAARP